MKKINYILKIIFFIYVLSQRQVNAVLDYKIVSIVLIAAAICIVKEKINDSLYVVIIEFIIITMSAYIYSSFIPLYVISVFDFTYEECYIGVVITAAMTLYLSKVNMESLFVFYIMAAIIAFLLRAFNAKEQFYTKIIDSERRLRYELEDTKIQLLNSSKEVVHIAEIKERNRIARDIHDNIGHSIAGIFMQLQVALKLYGKDDIKAKEILKNSIEGLSNSLKLLRETVHNIKPKENLGIEYITSILDNFKFCQLEFKHTGDISTVSPRHMETIVTNIKEALTNITKYSSATKAYISIEVNEKYIRLYIKDNGVGSKKIKEGLGLSGMRERVRNVGGSISISSEDGFLIVCIIPIDSKGGKIFETTNS
jgi:signal transduction histidine kinase